jgi:hypothetical protein
VNTFVVGSGDGQGGTKKIGASRKQSHGRLDPPKRAPAKFRGQVVRPQSVVQPASPVPRTAGTLTVKAEDPQTTAAIWVLTPRNKHHR